ncbi:MAG: hypothetical protein KDA80_18285, partial [Planctomycetaceae bacterium]|nr:hypothetical protein [Planctomycetaceae bacterium]
PAFDPEGRQHLIGVERFRRRVGEQKEWGTPTVDFVGSPKSRQMLRSIVACKATLASSCPIDHAIRVNEDDGRDFTLTEVLGLEVPQHFECAKC